MFYIHIILVLRRKKKKNTFNFFFFAILNILLLCLVHNLGKFHKKFKSTKKFIVFDAVSKMKKYTLHIKSHNFNIIIFNTLQMREGFIIYGFTEEVLEILT